MAKKNQDKLWKYEVATCRAEPRASLALKGYTVLTHYSLMDTGALYRRHTFIKDADGTRYNYPWSHAGRSTIETLRTYGKVTVHRKPKLINVNKGRGKGERFQEV